MGSPHGTNSAAVTAAPPPTGRPSRFELMPNWRVAHRMWSVRLKAAAVLLQGWFMCWPTFALNLWNQMPGQVADRLPRWLFVIPLLLFVASGVAQFIKQKKLHGRG